MKTLSLALAFGTLALLPACHSTIDTKADAQRAKPEWAVRGTGAFKGKSGVVFYGIGIASAMPNAALQRKAVDLRARENIAATLKTSVRSMVNDFMEHHADYFNPGGKASAEEMVKYTASGVSDAELSNCKIIDYWEDPKTGELYALAKLDLDDGFYGSYKENLRRALRESGATANIKESEALLKELNKVVEAQRFDAPKLVGATQDAAEPEAMKEP
jgi:hypothetical protein